MSKRNRQLTTFFLLLTVGLALGQAGTTDLTGVSPTVPAGL